MELGLQKKLYLGNLDAKRDWGHAGDFVRAMWLILQEDEPDDYVIATGEVHSVREFVELAFKEVGAEIEWKGRGIEEKGVISEIRGPLKPDAVAADSGKPALRAGDVVVQVDPRYFRPTEVDFLQGDATKARKKLGWKPRISFSDMVSEMVKADLEEASKDQLCMDSGFRIVGSSNE